MYVDTSRSHVSGGVFPTAQDRKKSKMLNDPYVQDDRTLVTSRLDYGNAVLFGVNVCLIQKLQMVQHSAARLTTRHRRCDHQHVTPSLIALHWLPVRWRINCKILLLTYRALHDLAPAYIISPYTPAYIISPYTPGPLERSADTYSCR